MSIRDRLGASAGAALRTLVPTRATRNPLTRRLYEWLAARGIVGSVLLRYELAAPSHASAAAPPGVVIERTTGAAVPDALATDADRAVVARDDGELIGHAMVSDRPVPVPPLGGRVTPTGRYIWGVSVLPAARGRGVGTALVAEAVALATDVGMAEQRGRSGPTESPVWTLIAPDNAPSRTIFARNGFVPSDWTAYVRVGPFEGRFGRPVTLDARRE